jgi:glycosyltransferase involved in cell wall biosynthesis
LNVTYFHRKPGPGRFSIERIFDDVLRHLPAVCVARRAVSRFESRGVWRRAWNILEAPLRGGDVNHVTGDVHYLTYLLPKRRTLLTVHDCGSLVRLVGWRRALVRFAWFWLPARRAGLVTVVSERTKAELVAASGCDPRKIVVVANPVSDSFRPRPKPFAAARPVVLHVGLTPNKNLKRVAEALRGVPCRLRVVGRIPEDDAAALRSAGVEFTLAADLDDAALVREYEQCDLLVFASTYEGFGLPIVEAQAVGRPVVTSDLSPMPEVAGGAACLVDPLSVASIRAGILRVIQDGPYREELIRKGLENAERYRADKIAAAYAELYERLAAGAAREKTPCAA